MTRRSVSEARQVAAMLQRSGYPNAKAAPEYCIDGEIGPDRFYTHTVSVYAGEYDESSIPPGICKALKSALARINK